MSDLLSEIRLSTFYMLSQKVTSTLWDDIVYLLDVMFQKITSTLWDDIVYLVFVMYHNVRSTLWD